MKIEALISLILTHTIISQLKVAGSESDSSVLSPSILLALTTDVSSGENSITILKSSIIASYKLLQANGLEKVTVFACLYNSSGYYNDQGILKLFQELSIPILFPSKTISYLCGLEHPDIINYDIFVEVRDPYQFSSQLPSDAIMQCTDGVSSKSFYCMPSKTALKLSSILLSQSEIREGFRIKLFEANPLIHPFLFKTFVKTQLSVDMSIFEEEFEDTSKSDKNMNIQNVQCAMKSNTFECEESTNPHHILNHKLVHYLFQISSDVVYHSSGPCNLWWPLNQSEIFIFSQPEDILF